MSSVPLPPTIWARLQELLASGRSGRFVVNVQNGRITGCEATDTVRVSQDDRTIAQTGCYTLD